MKKSLDDRISIAASVIGQCKPIKMILQPFYSRYKKNVHGAARKKRNELFQNNALEVISDFDKCLTNNGYKYTLAFGTLLGAVREHGFIKHDLDMDVAMWIDDYTHDMVRCLTESGFELVEELSVDDGQSGLELTFKKEGVDIDVFMIYPPIDQYPYCCDFMSMPGSASFDHSMKRFGQVICRRIQLPWEREFTRAPFMNLELPIPTNAHEILAFRYGDDYMTPNPSWTYTAENPYTTVWREKKGVAKVYTRK